MNKSGVVSSIKVFLYLYYCVNLNVHLFQNELSAATHLTSKLLKEYEKQVPYMEVLKI